jgi:hypothetical protein
VGFSATGRRSALLVIVSVVGSVAAFWNVASSERWTVSPQPAAKERLANDKIDVASPTRSELHDASETSPSAPGPGELRSGVRPSPAGPPSPALTQRPSADQQFALLGTTVAGQHGVAVIVERSNGSISVLKAGDRLGSLTVVSVVDARVTLGAGINTEELRVDAGPSTTRPLPTREMPSEDAAQTDLSASQQGPTIARNELTSSSELEVNLLIEQGGTVPNPR